MGQSWHKKLQAFRESSKQKLHVGWRSLAWIRSLSEDFRRWDFFDLEIDIENPVVVKGKVPVSIRKVSR